MTQAFKEYKGAFLLDECIISRNVLDKDGKTVSVPYNINKSKLEEIAERNNRRFNETGDKPPFITLHTDKEGNTTSEISGFAKDFKVEKFFNTDRYGISCTIEAFPEKVEEFRKNPRRSVELYLSGPKANIIDPIALLGGKTPARDLGLVHFECEKDGVFKFSYDPSVQDLGRMFADQSNLSSLTNPDPLQLLLEKLNNTAEFKFIQKLMKESETITKEETDDLLPQDDADGDDLLDVSDDESAKGKGKSDPADSWGGEKKDPKGEIEKMAIDEKTFEEFKVRLETLEKDKAKLSSEYSAQTVEVEGLKIKLRNSERKEKFQLLSREIQLNVDTELTHTAKFSDELFESHLKHIAATYPKATASVHKVNFDYASHSVLPVDDSVISREEATKLAEEAAAKGVDFKTYYHEKKKGS